MSPATDMAEEIAFAGIPLGDYRALILHLHLLRRWNAREIDNHLERALAFARNIKPKRTRL